MKFVLDYCIEGRTAAVHALIVTTAKQVYLQKSSTEIQHIPIYSDQHAPII